MLCRIYGAQKSPTIQGLFSYIQFVWWKHGIGFFRPLAYVTTTRIERMSPEIWDELQQQVFQNRHLRRGKK